MDAQIVTLKQQRSLSFKGQLIICFVPFNLYCTQKSVTYCLFFHFEPRLYLEATDISRGIDLLPLNCPREILAICYDRLTCSGTNTECGESLLLF